MREIKFRAWDKERKLMAKVFVMDLGNGSVRLDDTIISPEDNGRSGFQDVDSDVELMQYTGLKDKDGKEIYEGDIVEIDATIPDGKENRYNKEVKWIENGYWSVGNFWGSDPNSSFIKEANVEVIGNIYENKELLAKDPL